MFRNRLLPLHYPHCFYVQRKQNFPQHCAGKPRAKSSSNVVRQSRILGKLFGNRVAGTKKRWIPSADISGGCSRRIYQPPSVAFQASQFGKSNSPSSKHNTRRILVLNKLFMMSITDLLTTGKAAESVLGHNLQVEQVKISVDFSCINVYWLGSGNELSNAALEVQLQRFSGQLRHELSQLQLLGAIPRIRFVRDRTGSNIHSIERILRALYLSSPKEHLIKNKDQQQLEINVGKTSRHEFYGNAAAPPTTTAAMPKMRQDVLGLNHRQINEKILNKMRKSKVAWERQQQSQSKQLFIP